MKKSIFLTLVIVSITACSTLVTREGVRRPASGGSATLVGNTTQDSYSRKQNIAEAPCKLISNSPEGTAYRFVVQFYDQAAKKDVDLKLFPDFVEVSDLKSESASEKLYDSGQQGDTGTELQLKVNFQDGQPISYVAKYWSKTGMLFKGKPDVYVECVDLKSQP